MFRLRQTGFRFAAVFLALVTAVLVAEVLLRIVGMTPPYRQRDEGDLIIPEADVSYVYTPNLRDTIRTENYEVEIAINSHGYRDEAWQVNQDAVRILAVGNSFTGGYGVPAEDRWPDRLETILNGSERRVQVFNAAVSGYNLKQMATTVKKLNDVIRPDLVLLGLYLDGLNRLRDPFVYYKGFSVRASIAESVHVEDDRLYLLHFDNTFLRSTELWLQKQSRVFAVVLNAALVLKQSLTEKSATRPVALLEKTKTQLSELNAMLQRQDTPLVLIAIVQHNAEGEFESRITQANRLLLEYCHANEIHVIDLLPAFREQVVGGRRFWIEDDRHWNEHAHRLAAKHIAHDLSQRNLLNTKSGK